MTEGEKTEFLAGPEAYLALRRHLGPAYTVDEIGRRCDDSTLIFKVWSTRGLDVYSDLVRVRRRDGQVQFTTVLS